MAGQDLTKLFPGLPTEPRVAVSTWTVRENQLSEILSDGKYNAVLCWVAHQWTRGGSESKKVSCLHYRSSHLEHSEERGREKKSSVVAERRGGILAVKTALVIIHLSILAFRACSLSDGLNIFSSLFNGRVVSREYSSRSGKIADVGVHWAITKTRWRKFSDFRLLITRFEWLI